MTNPDFEKYQPEEEVKISETLRDTLLNLLPKPALDRNINFTLLYYIKFGSFIEILHDPTDEDGQMLIVSLVETETLYGQASVSEDGKIIPPPTKQVGTQKRLWISPESGAIDCYFESTGELKDGDMFVADNLFPTSSSINIDLPITREDFQLNKLNESYCRFTQTKLDELITAFDSLGT